MPWSVYMYHTWTGCPLGPNEFGERGLEALLQLGVRHNKDALLISGHQTDLLRHSRVQLKYPQTPSVY